MRINIKQVKNALLRMRENARFLSTPSSSDTFLLTKRNIKDIASSISRTKVAVNSSITDGFFSTPSSLDIADKLSFEEWSSSNFYTDQEQQLQYYEFKSAIDKALSQLNQQRERVIRLRLGLGRGGRAFDNDRADKSEYDYAHNYEEIGNIEGVTRERVRQIERESIKRLCHFNVLHFLIPFAEDPYIKKGLLRSELINTAKKITGNINMEKYLLPKTQKPDILKISLERLRALRAKIIDERNIELQRQVDLKNMRAKHKRYLTSNEKVPPKMKPKTMTIPDPAPEVPAKKGMLKRIIDAAKYLFE